MLGNGGGGEIALFPVAIDTAAQNIFFAAAFEYLAVGGPAVGGGIHQRGPFNIMRFEQADGVGDGALLDQLGDLGVDFGADHRHLGAGLQKELDFT